MTPETQKRAQQRLRIIAGQIDALEKQIADDKYCMDVLDLSMSIQKALRSLDALVIEGHLRTHVAEQFQGGEQERAVRELLRLYKVQGPAEPADPNAEPAPTHHHHGG